MKRIQLLFGISILWLPLSMLFDGLNTLILPAILLGFFSEDGQATVLGVMTFSGLAIGMLIQPVAGMYSDQLYSRWGRRGIITFGVMLLIPLLLLFTATSTFVMLFVVYLLIQVVLSIIQAGQQGFISDRVPPAQRGMASGIKNLMDVGGALLVFMILAQLFSEGKAHLVIPVIIGVFLLTLFLTVISIDEPSRESSFPPPHVTLAAAFQLDLNQHRAFVWVIISRFLFLLGTYAVGRFLLFFAAERLNLDANVAGEKTAQILAVLTLITILCAPAAGWLADHVNRIWVMVFGSGISALGVILLMTARMPDHIILFGGLMGIGSAAFAAANWALTTDLAPPTEAARFLALANFGTAGAAAVAGLFGPLIDLGNRLGAGQGFTWLFMAAATAFIASGFAVYRMGANQALGTSGGQAPDQATL